MSIPDLWSLITGIASILGLAFSLPKKFSAWRKYTLPITYTFGGIAIGRMSVNLSPSIDAVFQDPYLLVTLIVILVIVSLPTVLIIFMARRNYLFNPIVFFLLITLVLIPQFPSIYSAFKPEVSVQDYLELAIMKEQEGKWGSAINYYQKYLQATDDLSFNMQIERKISTLKSNQLNKIVK